MGPLAESSFPADVAAVLAEIRSWVLGLDGLLTPGILQRGRRMSFNAACSMLERLEKEGELVRVPAPTHTWRRASKAEREGRRTNLSLSREQADALHRLLDAYLVTESHDPDLPVLRQVFGFLGD